LTVSVLQDFLNSLLVRQKTQRVARSGAILRRLAHTDLLILDDWGLHVFVEEARRDFHEVVEDRCEKRSTLFHSC
jgi:DNA replication protein DnaC